jgi:hypothetical protein
MNKLDVAVNLIYKQAGNKKINVKAAFDLAYDVEKEAIRRGLHFPELCPVCGESTHIQNMSSMTDSYYRIKCKCADVRGKDMQTVINQWLAEWGKRND